MLAILIISIINLIAVGALIYGFYKFSEMATYYLKSSDDYILKLYKVVDKNFKTEAEILNSITEWKKNNG
jgi:hypothetical protein